MSLRAHRIRTRHAEVSLVETSGRSMAVLLLHGAAAAKEVFSRQLSHPMGDMYRMIALDWPGHGASENAADPAACYSVTGLADVASEVLAALGIERAAVFGWSMGGHVAIELAATHPGIAGLMLTGAPPVAPGVIGMLRGFHANWDMLLASKEVYSPRDAERFAKLCFGDNPEPAFLDMILRSDGRARAHFPKSLMRGEGADQRRTIERTDIPVAVVNGADDHFVRVGYPDSLTFRALFEDRCHVVEGAGHAPFWQQPEQFNLILQRFLKHVYSRELGIRREEQRRSRIA